MPAQSEGCGGTGVTAVQWKRDLAWVAGAILVILAVAGILLLSCPSEKRLPQVYDVL